LAQQPLYPSVGDAYLQEFHEALVVERVEESPDIRIQYPIDLTAHESNPQRVQRIMLVAPRPESVAESQEVHLVNRIENLHHGPLDYLVFQRRDADGPNTTTLLHRPLFAADP
jgi:hypothetical protein